MMNDRKVINEEIINRLDTSVKRYRQMVKDIDDLERAIITGDVQELRHALGRIYDHIEAIKNQIRRVGELASKKIKTDRQREYVNSILDEAEGSLMGIYAYVDEIEENLRTMSRGQLNDLLKELKYYFKELGRHLNDSYLAVDY